MAGEEFVYRSELEKTPLPEILTTIHRYGVPGVLEVSREDITKKVFFLDGDVIFATSTDRSESLGEYLIRSGEITREQLAQSSEELASAPGARHGEVLVRMGFLSQGVLGKSVRRQVQSIVWSLFNWNEGHMCFTVGTSREDETFKIKIPTARAVLAGCRRIEDPKIITARLGGRGAIFKRLPKPAHLEKFRFEADELELLELVDGKRNLFELCEQGPLSPGANARVLYALVELQLVTMDPSSSGKILIQVRG
ncbi:MAG: DUF4388 domain-containing protein [Acidobacteriota bacterium]|nr:DUF4388 domain-containing protein [Acidobacteriota bacterium]